MYKINNKNSRTSTLTSLLITFLHGMPLNFYLAPVDFFLARIALDVNL